MLTAHQLVEAAKARQNIPSNYRLARVLGVTDNTVANWRHGRTVPDEETTMRLADMAGMDPAEVMPAMEALRATDPAVRLVWQRVAERMHAAALAAFAAILSLWIGGGPDGSAMAATREAKAPSAALWIAESTRYTSSRILQLLMRLAGAVFRRPVRPSTARPRAAWPGGESPLTAA